MHPPEEGIGAEPALIDPPAEDPVPWWRRPVVLASLVLLLVTSSLLSVRSPSRRQSGERAELALETSMMAREVYAMRRNPLFRFDTAALKTRQRELLANFRRLVQLNRSADSLRKLAVLQFAVEDEGWRETLARMRGLPRAESFATEKELAMWAEVMGAARVPQSAVPEFEAAIKRFDLGWYSHLALEGLYRKAGLVDQADEAAARAQAPFNRLLVIGLLGFLVLLAGLGFGILMALYLNWARRNPHQPAPRFLEIRPPPALDRAKGQTLYFVFLIYLVSFAVIQMGVGRLLGLLVGKRLMAAPDFVLPLISLATVLVWLAIPVFALIKLAPRTGLTAFDMGLKSRDVFGDILWGVGGWMVALPIVLAVSIGASFIFRGIETPSHPAIMELAASRNPLTILLLFVQASVLAPISEELMFRGVFFRSLTPRMRWIPAVVVTSSVFAILHPQLPLGFFGLFTLGATFNVLYALRGNLLPAMVAHAVNNTVILIAVLLILGS